MSERVLAREDLRPLHATSSHHGSIAVASGMDDLHELRVRIPVNLHRQLLSLKVLRGRSLAETVSLALDQYFAQVKAPATAEEKDAKSAEN